VRRDWREHAEAFDEYRAAASWYDDRSEGLGVAFMDAVDAAVESILDPSIKWGFYRGRKRSPQVYSRSVAGFPFDVIYVDLSEEIVVIAYAHEKRRPGYWTRRLDG
jgi:hypothetical protein